jgi:hypothetical protein
MGVDRPGRQLSLDGGPDRVGDAGIQSEHVSSRSSLNYLKYGYFK